jgi:hypothetical protein
MFARDTQVRARLSLKLLLACLLGLLTALFALFHFTLPTWATLAQFATLSPLERASWLVKLLSPALCFILSYEWVYAGSWLGELIMPVLQQWSHDAISATAPGRRPPEHISSQSRQASYQQAPSVQRIAVPPLFQRDPSLPLSALPSLPRTLPETPLPDVNPAWLPEQDEDAPVEESMTDKCEEERNEAQAELGEASSTSSEAIEVRATSDAPNEVVVTTVPASSTPITLTLLKKMSVTVHAPGGTTRKVKLRLGENGIRLILLAYIAWRKGAPVDRDKILTYVYSRGRRKDVDVDRLNDAFDSAKKYLREDLKTAVSELNHAMGNEVITEVDFFEAEAGFYRLHPSCRVTDLEELEALYQPVQHARKEGLLDENPNGLLPDTIIFACQQILRTYPGDFLQELLEKYPDAFGSWVREPFTLYRDYYLDALWILATHESALGRILAEKPLLSEQQQEQQRQHIAKAAQYFYDYAMYAINSRWDSKLQFACLPSRVRVSKDGERVIMATRAIRRCVVEQGRLGKTDAVDQMYGAFKDRMLSLSDGLWEPDQETESDVMEAKKQTSAYRFPAQMFAPQKKSEQP